MELGIRTSSSHPLRIAELQVGTRGGAIGITFCPGKCGPSTRGGAWQRDLAMDVEAIRAWGAAAVLTLIEDHEFDMLRVRQLGAEIRSRGMQWHHLPIVDLAPPDERFERAWEKVCSDLGFLLLNGGRVLVHCRGGLGRAGTVAARMLIEQGLAPLKAIREVRRVRPKAIETSAQEAYLHRLRPGRKQIAQYYQIPPLEEMMAAAQSFWATQPSCVVKAPGPYTTFENQAAVALFCFNEIDHFDARRGLRRCRLPGSGSGFFGESQANAEYWWNAEGDLLVRFTSQNYRFSFAVELADGRKVPDQMLEHFDAAMEEILFEWLIDGIDDSPTVPTRPEPDDE